MVIRSKKSQFLFFMIVLAAVSGAYSAAAEPGSCPADVDKARKILDATGVEGGVIVQIGCGDGSLTSALRANASFKVHGLDRDETAVEKARERIRSLGIYGPVSVDLLRGDRLPYIENFVNLVVSEELGGVPMEEVERVLCPNGVAYIKRSGVWTKTVKPRPEGLDEWTHYMYDASNNAVSHDEVVGPPRRLQWVGGSRYGRHHDRMSSMSAAASAGGRVFYIFDEGSRISALTPPKWSLIARDAFNGTILWKRRMERWHTHLWPLKSGPAQLPRRLIAAGDRVYVTLNIDSQVAALDAATGETVMTYGGTRGTEEVILAEGVLYALVNGRAEEPEYANMDRIKKAYRAQFWDESPRRITAIRAGTGEKLWSEERTVLPGTLAAAGESVFFHDGRCVVCLDGSDGKEIWHTDPVPRSEIISSFYLPTLLVYEDVVLFSGGETAGMQTGSWYMSGTDTMTAVSAKTGEPLWKSYHPPSGYRSPEDLLVAGGLVWTGETTSGRAEGVFTGRDPYTGEVMSQFAPGIDTYWFHHRCYRGKATDSYLLTARAGTEFIDVNSQEWTPHYWVRGACLYGLFPANGLLYAPQHPCACYLEAKLSGFNAVAPAMDGPRIPAQEEGAGKDRLEVGAAYGCGKNAPASADPEDWPTFRHDVARSGCAGTAVGCEALKKAWQADLGGRLTSPVIAGGRVFVASVDAHAIHALDAASGAKLWRFTAGGRIDSPPTVYKGMAFFGSADGWVYCLRASDGALAWRFRAAPMDQRLMSYEQIESVWPVHGSVLIMNGVLYCVAGRSGFMDSGMRLWRLDADTGRVLSKTVLDDNDPRTGKDLQSYVSWLNMPVALPDILSSDGNLVYMRSKPFELDGSPLPIEKHACGPNADNGAVMPTQRPDRAHLFSPTGFLDDHGWHRSYWLYGSTFTSGWSGYYLAGKTAPAGKILVFDDTTVYGFGRKPKYYRWTVPIEHHFFAADKAATEGENASSKTFKVKHLWTEEPPIFARALVLSDGKLFAAGPPDLMDEPEIFDMISTPEALDRLEEQAAALDGKKGALLLAVSACDGKITTLLDLDSPPVFDGMAAAKGGLFVTTTSGKVLCIREAD